MEHHHEDGCCCHDHHDHEHIHEEEMKSQFEQALALYNLNIDDEKIGKEVSKLLSDHLQENNNKEVKKCIFNCIDFTTLNETDSDISVMKFTKKVNHIDEEHPEIGNVAAICVYPSFVEIVHDTLEVESVNIASVAGGFPSAQTFSEVKVAETALAVRDGATEIDIVMPVGKFLEGEYEEMCDEIGELKDICRDRKLKVILETGSLKTAVNIKKASILCMYAGADFIKTSTGKTSIGATPEAAYVMCKAIKEYFQKTGIRKGFKAAGGLKTVEDAVKYYTIVKEVLGKEWLNSKYFRIGTSSLAEKVLGEITD